MTVPRAQVRKHLIWGPYLYMLLGTVFLIVGFTWLLYRGSPLRYQQPSTPNGSPSYYYRGTLAYMPEQEVVAPGATLNYTPTLVIAHGGKWIDIRRTLYTTKDQRARDCDGKIVEPTKDGSGPPEYFTGLLRDNAVHYTVPRVPPGEYSLSNVASGRDGESNYVIIFRVDTPCG